MVRLLSAEHGKTVADAHGEIQRGLSGLFGEVYDPNTGEVQARVPLADRSETEAAIANAVEERHVGPAVRVDRRPSSDRRAGALCAVAAFTDAAADAWHRCVSTIPAEPPDEPYPARGLPLPSRPDRFPAIRDLTQSPARQHPWDTVTPDGNEIAFQVNFLAHYLLTHLLEPALTSGVGGRVVNASSSLTAPVPSSGATPTAPAATRASRPTPSPSSR